MTRIVLAGAGCSISFSERGEPSSGDLTLLTCRLENLRFRSVRGIFASPLPRSDLRCLPWQALQQFATAICCSASRVAHAETRRLLELLAWLSGAQVRAEIHRWYSWLISSLARITSDQDTMAIARLVNSRRPLAAMLLPPATGRALLRYRGFSPKSAWQRISPPCDLTNLCRPATPSSPAQHTLPLLDVPVSDTADSCCRDAGTTNRLLFSVFRRMHSWFTDLRVNVSPLHRCFRAWPEANEQS